MLKYFIQTFERMIIMEQLIITSPLISDFAESLEMEEKSRNTVEKYLRDVRAFQAYTADKPVTKEMTVRYKEELLEKGYAISSINSMIASVNSFFTFAKQEHLKLKTIKVQRQIFSPEEKELTREEYERLIKAAQQNGNERLNLIIQTICGTGIRVSELRFVTVESVQRGEAVVLCKGKRRSVFIVKALQKKLLRYIKDQKIKTGSVFVTRNGNPVSRSNIWRDMKKLCKDADVCPSKVFPHNLRHLFARVFYGLDKDIAKLADILGHSSINTTRIYIISTGTEHRRKMENMKLVL